jgi:hypothetical protein
MTKFVFILYSHLLRCGFFIILNFLELMLTMTFIQFALDLTVTVTETETNNKNVKERRSEKELLWISKASSVNGKLKNTWSMKNNIYEGRLVFSLFLPLSFARSRLKSWLWLLVYWQILKTRGETLKNIYKYIKIVSFCIIFFPILASYFI